MQLSIIDNNQENLAQESLSIHWIDTNKLYPHPNNPRLIYKEDVINSITESLKKDGFQPCYALLVRTFNDGYQVISGHTRLKAAALAGITKLPCWVKEMSDYEAFLELVRANNQGELSPLEIGIHALTYAETAQGKEGKGLQAYAEEIGKTKSSISMVRQAALVYKLIHTCEQVTVFLDKARHLYEISKAPEIYWQQLTELLLEKEWSVKQTEEVVKAIKDIDIPEQFYHWLNPGVYIKRTISEVINDGDVRTPRDVKNWVTAAQEELNKLSDNRETFVIKDGIKEIIYFNLKQIFLNRLPELSKGDKQASKTKIEGLASSVVKQVQIMDKAYQDYIKSKASEEEKLKAKEAKEQEVRELKAKYSPIGINANIEDLTSSSFDTFFDAIITDPPYLLSNGGTTVRSGKEVSVNKNFADSSSDAIHPKDYMRLCFEVLKPGGYFVATCTPHLLFDLRNEALKAGFEFRQLLFWVSNNPPLMTADRFNEQCEMIFIAIKPGDTPYFGYEDIKIDDKQRSTVIEIPKCNGKERLGWHDTQKPLTLWELLIKAYCPVDGSVLDLFGGSGTAAVACKRLQRLCTWVEIDETFYKKATDRIDDSSYFFES